MKKPVYATLLAASIIFGVVELALILDKEFNMSGIMLLFHLPYILLRIHHIEKQLSNE